MTHEQDQALRSKWECFVCVDWLSDRNYGENVWLVDLNRYKTRGMALWHALVAAAEHGDEVAGAAVAEMSKYILLGRTPKIAHYYSPSVELITE